MDPQLVDVVQGCFFKGFFFSMPTAKEVFVDLLAVSFGDKPAVETSEPCKNHVFSLNKRT